MKTIQQIFQFQQEFQHAVFELTSYNMYFRTGTIIIKYIVDLAKPVWNGPLEKKLHIGKRR